MSKAAIQVEGLSKDYHLLVRPVSRLSWLSGRIAVATASLTLAGLLAGLLTWVSAASQHSGVALTSLLQAGLNTVPAALCILGIGVLVMGIWPRATAVITYGLLAWSLLIQFAGGFFSSSHWLLDTSVFHHMAAAPTVSPDWVSAAALTATGALAAMLGALAFSRRDLAGE